MYKRSDNSDSQNRDNTAITGQSGKLPREGIISDTGKNRDSSTEAKSSTAEFSTQKSSAEAMQRTAAFSPVERQSQKNGNRTPRQDGTNERAVTAEMRAVGYQTGTLPRTGRRPVKRTFKQKLKRALRKAKRRFFILLYNFLCAVIEHKKEAIAVAACVLIIGISVPVAVYATEKQGGSDEPDIELVESGTSVAEDVILSEDVELGKMYSLIGVADDGEADKAVSEDTEEPEDTEETTSEQSEEETATETETADTEEPTEESTQASDTDTEEPYTEVVPDNRFAVTVYFYDRESVTCMTGPATLGEILSNAGIWLLDTDRITVDLDTYIEEACAIGVDKVEYKTVTESEPIPFQVDTYNVQSVPRGTTQVVGEGVNGSKDTVYTVEYYNGVEVSRVKEYDYVASNPVNQVNYYGVGGTFTAPDGTEYSFSYAIECKATYYNIHGTTASGLPTGDNIVAVDPNVFPLGTNLYVMSDIYDMGHRIAADTGGAVKGNFIDLWMDVGSPNYDRFSVQGVGYMMVYVLD